MPLFWKQKAKGPTKVKIIENKNVQVSFNKHVDETKRLYGKTLYLNLLSTEKEDEERLTSLLLQAMRTKADHDVRIIQYDYHA